MRKKMSISLGIMLIAQMAMADPLSIPHVAISGETIRSSDYNRNFAAVQSAVNNITSSQITDGTITSDDLSGSLSITAGMIADDAVTREKLDASCAGDGLKQAGLIDNAPGSLKVNVDGADIDNPSREGTLEISDDVLRISSGAAGRGIAGGSGASLYVDVDDSTIELSDSTDAEAVIRLKDAGITAAKIANGDHGDFTYSSNVATLDNGVVSTAKIANGAVTTEKIANGAVTAEKIANSAVTSAKIADGTITTTDLASSVLTVANIPFASNSIFSYPTSLPVEWTYTTAGTNQMRLEDKLSGLPTGYNLLVCLSVNLVVRGSAWQTLRTSFTVHGGSWTNNYKSPTVTVSTQVATGTNDVILSGTVVVPFKWDATGPGHYANCHVDATHGITWGIVRVTPYAWMREKPI